jgi:hypothetical protein
MDWGLDDCDEFIKSRVSVKLTIVPSAFNSADTF